MLRAAAAIGAAVISLGLFAGCMRMVPVAVQEQAARGLVARCATMTYSERLIDRETFYQQTKPDKLVIYCEGDPDYPKDDGGAD